MPHPKFNTPAGPYFLSHSVGLQPLSARAELDSLYLDPWAAGDAGAWDAWLLALQCFREALAPIIGARAEDICPQTNISSALTKALFSLKPKPGRRKIFLAEDDFPTIGFVLAQGERLGLELAFLKGGGRLADPDAWSEAFAEDVHLLHVTHVFSNLGLRAPVAEIVARARARGVLTVVDVAQSAGAVAVRADDWGADFLIGTSVKYLCGGAGAAFLWVNPARVSDCRPLDVGWFSHRHPFAFDVRHFEFAGASDRFLGGTPSIAPFALAAAGLRALADPGIGEIERRNQALLDRIIGAAPENAFLSHIARGERGSAFIVRPQQLENAKEALRDERIIHDERAGGLRFSVHLYNDETDADRLISALRPFL